MAKVNKYRASLLRYPGGKARFAPLIAEIAELNGLKAKRLVEPFCGGAGVAISLMQSDLVGEIALNDLDPLVSALWSVVFNPDESKWLIDQVHTVPLTLDEWHRQKTLVPTDVRTMALKCLYLNRTSFNGILYVAGPLGGKLQDKRTVGVRFNRDFLAEKIEYLSSFSDRVTVSNMPWSTVMDKEAQNANSFFYIDPPYYYKAESLYGFVFDDDGHKALRDYLLTMNAPWVLSYDDVGEVRGLYAHPNLFSRVLDQTYSAHPRGGASSVKKELLFSNLPLLPSPSEKKHSGVSVREGICRESIYPSHALAP
ncbi:DNA adenine methylase [Nostoc sp. CHAB 5834]|nr:DNA adenine methylase [Nostoc sp. CHAB 5834]